MSEATSGMPHGADPHIAPLMRAKGLSAPAQRGRGTTRSMMEGAGLLGVSHHLPHRLVELVIGPATSGRTRWLDTSLASGGG
jgi:hypothetical protein